MADNKEKKIQKVSFGKLAVLFGTFLTIIVLLASDQTHKRLHNSIDRRLEQQISETLDKPAIETIPQVYAGRLFKAIEDTAKTFGPKSNELAEKIKECETKYKTGIKAFFYHNRELINHFNADSNDLAVFTDLIKNINITDFEKIKKLQIETYDLLTEYFGNGFRLRNMQNKFGAVSMFRSKDSEHFFYGINGIDGLSLCLVTYNFPDFITRFNVLYKDNPKFGAGNKKDNIYVVPQGFSSEQMQVAAAKTKMEGKHFTSFGDNKWFFSFNKNSDFICRVLNENELVSEETNISEMIFKVSFVLLVTLIIIYITGVFNIMPGAQICRMLDNASVRARIVAVCIMVSLFPVLMIYLLGSSSIQEKKETLETAILQKSLRSLSSIENLYDKILDDVHSMADELYIQAEDGIFTEEDYYALHSKYNVNYTGSRIEIRDGNLNTIYTNDDNKTMGAASVMDMVARIALNRHAPERANQITRKLNAADYLGESVLGSDEFGFSQMVSKPGRMWNLDIGVDAALWGWKIYPKADSKAAFVSLSMVPEHLYSLRIEEALYNINKDPSDRLMASKHSNTDYSMELIPAGISSDIQQIIDYGALAFTSNKVIYRTIKTDNKEFRLTCRTSDKLSNYILYDLTETEKYFKELIPLKREMMTDCIIALLISFIGAIIIVRLTVIPVSDLSKGIKAIRNRDRYFSIPVRRNDEFGAAAEAFNKMLAGFDELEYGKYVQTNLLPSKPIVPEGYDIAMFNVSATDLAGDYHDTLLLKDGRLMLLLGDVSGHGVASSIAMAMAKATVTYSALKEKEFPSDVLTYLNSIFRNELQKKKMMTCVIVVLDPKTGELTFDNMGQNFPYYYTDAEDNVAELEMPSLPVGTVKRRRPFIMKKTMEKGDVLIQYTDGIVECTNEKNEMFGYDTFSNYFYEYAKKGYSASKIIKELMNRLDEFRAPGLYPDDITMIVTRRKADK